MKHPITLKSNAKGGAMRCLAPFPREHATAFESVRADSEQFLLQHLWLPLLAFTLLVIVLMLWGGDVWIADRLYAWQGHRWALKSAFITDTAIHLVGRDLSTLAWIGVCAAWLVSRSRETLAQWRRPLGLLALSVLVSTALVAWIKSWSNMDCPWDLLRYGGDRPFVGLLSLRPMGLGRGACFPAGHASAGYSWMALYFFFLAVHPRLRWLGLSAGVAAGLLFGFSQQLRGAHFLSHDAWTAAICWLTSLGMYWLSWSLAGEPSLADAASAPATTATHKVSQ